MLQQYLEKLGFDEKERTIYLILAEIGVQPASVIARRSNLDRVTAYKHLKKLADRGFVKVYFRDGVQCFGVESFETIEAHLRDRADESHDLLSRFPVAVSLLKSLRGGEDIIPRLQMFEGEAGIKALFRDMLFTVKQEGVQQIRMLTSNTFEEWLGDEPLSKTVRSFFSDLREQKVDVEVFEATGALVPERLRRLSFRTLDLARLPVARGTTNVFLVAHTVYLACYKGNQIGLKIKQADMSQIFHFLFDTLGKITG